MIELNGATAHLGKIGDRLTIMSFAQVPAELADKHQPTVVRLDEKNNVLAVGRRADRLKPVNLHLRRILRFYS